MRLKCIAIATAAILGMMMMMSSCQSEPKPFHTYKVYLYDGSEYTVRGTGFYTHNKFDSVQTVFWGGGGTFFNVKAVVQANE